MRTVKEIAKSVMISLCIALMIFCAVGVFFEVRGGGTLDFENYSFTKMVIGCLAVGLGFGIPSIVYDRDQIPRPVQVIVHMGIGCLVYIVVAYLVGWFGSIKTPVHFLILSLCYIAVAFIIWVPFMLFYRREAVKMNEKLQVMKGKN
ncbi:MAG: DUF3021 domain-containing protein [Clostridiales bacterium]|nr:DUF3021 domain-containing protein [Clostridiales bacterium]